ncbi:MAG: VWA domain-containing protein [Acidobacteria bacterium]|nr:MAG: VWA domain-containing protein [Acidobacteriota bacterium]
MRAHHPIVLPLLFLLFFSLATQAASRNTPVVLADSRPVDLVIVLDTSGSMEELLDSVRARVWDIINEFGRMRPTPYLRVGLLSYGSDDSTEEDGWIVLHSDLTDDLDALYAELMALRTSGSVEYVGRALDVAVHEMDWSPDWDGLRLVFVAGNESADQGMDEVDFRQVALDAGDKDILINALYAGNREQGVSENWHEVAQHGHGNFSAIDVKRGMAQIPTPHDELLLRLNASLNETYLPYGERGADGLANQLAQDNNASRLGVESCSSRIVAKGSALYTNASWDLVDAMVKEEFQIASLRTQDLPEEMQGMEEQQRVAYVQAKRAQREDIQRQIQELSAEREAFLVQAKRDELGALGLDEAIRQAIRAQAKAKGFTCDGC